jgi:GntR family transcriptional regulator
MPTFTEIADDIERRIKTGQQLGEVTLAPGVRLPTTQQIADEYGVSEATAYRALVLLGEGGRKIIRGEPGRARFVVGPPPADVG